MKPDRRNINEILDRYLPSASKDEIESVGARVLHELRSSTHDEASIAAAATSVPVVGPVRTSFLPWRRIAMVSAAAAVLLAIFIGTALMRRQGNAFAVVETVEGALYRIVSEGDGVQGVQRGEGTGVGLEGLEGNAQAIPVGETLERGETVRTNGGAGAVLVLADGSRVEMRSQSELSLERAADGMRIRLSRGGVIVTAARQRTGHLYVQTKDVTVSVVGTVFLVNAEEAGSRVAVIQGEVQVEHGATAKKLLPGQQVATNPLMEFHPVIEEVSWSRNADAYLDLLQPAGPAAASPGDVIAPAPLEFKAASIKSVPNGSASVGWYVAGIACRGTDGTVDSAGPSEEYVLRQVGVSSTAPLPQGTCIGNYSLSRLLAFAYDIRLERISGDPGWTYPRPSANATDQPQRFQIEVKAENASSATTEQLRQMLQTFLSDRFKLKVHREIGETQGYLLLAEKNGVKFKEASGHEQRVNGIGQRVGPLMTITIKGNFRLKRFADFLSQSIPLPVIDRTNLPGIYDINLRLDAPLALLPPPLAGRAGIVPELNTALHRSFDTVKALEDQLGLRLEPGKVPIEYLVIDHAEKPADTNRTSP